MPLESIIIIALLSIILLFLVYLTFNHSQPSKNDTQTPLVIQTHLTNLQQAIQNSSQTLTQINTILLSPLQRGHLGNTQLEHLLAIYLPHDGKAFQLEYRLKKPTGKGGFLIADAFLFGLENKNNLAIDSKFPLENYLLLNNQSLSELERKEAEKNFKRNLKEHISKVSEYISEEDNCPHALIFFPSEAIFAKIQEANFEDIRQLAMDKKVSLCSPVTLAIIINQILWATKTWSEYRSLDVVLLELRKFWEEMLRFQDRWEKIKLLEKIIAEITALIKKLHKKTLTAYPHFCTEKELLQKLIGIHLELRKINKRYSKEFGEIYEKLENKLGKKVILEKVEPILADCEKLIEWELELETKLNGQLNINWEKQIVKITHQNNIYHIDYSGTFTSHGNMLVGNFAIPNNADFSTTNINNFHSENKLIESPKGKKKLKRRNSQEEKKSSKKTRKEEELLTMEIGKEFQLQVQIPPK